MASFWDSLFLPEQDYGAEDWMSGGGWDFPVEDPYYGSELGSIADQFQTFGVPDFTAYTPPPADYVTAPRFEIPSFQAPSFEAPSAESPLEPSAAFQVQRAGERAFAPPVPEVAAPTQPGIVARAVKGLTESPGKTLQAGLGLGSLALIGKGLLTKSPTAKVPDRRTALSPEEQAAATTLAERRAAAAGTLASRGYAGEEGIRQTVNQQLQAALLGDDLVSPELVRRRDDDLRAFEDQLRTDLGPGFSVSTAGRNALDNRRRMWEDLFEQERQRKITDLNAMGLSRSSLYNTLEMQPAELARAELGTLADIGSQDAALRYSAAAADAAQTGATNRALVQTGGQLAGVAAAPLLYQQLLESLRKK